VAGDPRFSVSAVEIERGLRYTVDTLAALAELSGPAELWLIIGSDSLLTLSTWKDPDAVLKQARLAVAARPGDDEASVAAAAARYDAVMLRSPLVAISSTDVRWRVRCRMPIRYLVPREVERLIRRGSLYVGAAES
jgi:nicotinate-nucleotide adenylyltransferase